MSKIDSQNNAIFLHYLLQHKYKKRGLVPKFLAVLYLFDNEVLTLFNFD
jgi:hypothetical protein